MVRCKSLRKCVIGNLLDQLVRAQKVSEVESHIPPARWISKEVEIISVELLAELVGKNNMVSSDTIVNMRFPPSNFQTRRSPSLHPNLLDLKMMPEFALLFQLSKEQNLPADFRKQCFERSLFLWFRVRKRHDHEIKRKRIYRIQRGLKCNWATNKWGADSVIEEDWPKFVAMDLQQKTIKSSISVLARLVKEDSFTRLLKSGLIKLSPQISVLRYLAKLILTSTGVVRFSLKLKMTTGFNWLSHKRLILLC